MNEEIVLIEVADETTTCEMRLVESALADAVGSFYLGSGTPLDPIILDSFLKTSGVITLEPPTSSPTETVNLNISLAESKVSGNPVAINLIGVEIRWISRATAPGGHWFENTFDTSNIQASSTLNSPSFFPLNSIFEPLQPRVRYNDFSEDTEDIALLKIPLKPTAGNIILSVSVLFSFTIPGNSNTYFGKIDPVVRITNNT